MRTGKLVRDKIPDIIRANGENPIIKMADPDDYGRRLTAKLAEEVLEFIASNGDLSELADVQEVVMALADLCGGRHELEKLRAEKAAERGAFTNGIIWYGNIKGAS